MAPNRVAGLANPALLVWARETIGMSQVDAAKKLNVSPEKIQSWEQGETNPTLNQLRRLANIYKRPLAVFYLPSRPADFQPLKDFRRPEPSGSFPRQSPDLMLAIRSARDRREWALELYEVLEGQPPNFPTALGIDDEVEQAATTLRKAIGIRFDQQTQWRLDYEALRNWRWTIESAGILTFQASDVETREARGFSIGVRPLPVVVANVKDAPRGRIFTFLHEVVHVMLNEGALCDFSERQRQHSQSFRTELFCNQVAGAALFPRSEFLATEVVRLHRKGDPTWTDSELQELSRGFGGSREAALVRLLSLRMTTWNYYLDKREELYGQYQKAREKQEGFAAPHAVAISNAGPTFTRLVIEGFDRNRITSSDVSDYLQIRIKHLADIKREISQPGAHR